MSALDVWCPDCGGDGLARPHALRALCARCGGYGVVIDCPTCLASPAGGCCAACATVYESRVATYRCTEHGRVGGLG